MSLLTSSTIEQFELPAPNGDGSITISISRPEQAGGGDRETPVLYVTDGDLLFGIAAEIARYRGYGGLSQPVVVGIGYGLPFLEFAKRRTEDLTPPQSDASAKAAAPMSALIGNQSGGADAFLAFLSGPLADELARRCPQTANGERILFGHSLGGLFAMHALLTRPDAFDVYLASSPALWWDDFAIMERLPAFQEMLAKREKQPRVFIGVGGKEQDPPTTTHAGISLADIQAAVARSRMVDAAREMSEALSGMGVHRIEHAAFAGEEHGTVVPAAIARGLGFALGNW